MGPDARLPLDARNAALVAGAANNGPASSVRKASWRTYS